jgi:cytochrome c oxidase subunit III
MDLTQGSTQEKQSRASKMMVIVGIISLVMTFGGLTSAFIVSSSRIDWLKELVLPNAFFWSTALILLSSFCLIMGRRSVKKGLKSRASLFIAVTLVMGIAFLISQFVGFQQIVESGYNFTGPTSNITMSYIYVITVLHILHVVAGLIALLVVLIMNQKGAYSPSSMTGFDMAAIFWHFVDLLWIYLFIFFVTF